MREKAAVRGSLAVAAAAVLAAAGGGRAHPASAAGTLAACTNVKLGMMAPLTGPAAFLGQEQLSWVRFAVSKFNKQHGTRFGIVQGDTQLSADLARTVGRRFVADRSVIGVVGGSTNQSVLSSGDLFKRAQLVSVSGWATRVDLTNGQFPTFFRVVPRDSDQARAIAGFLRDWLRVRRVTVMDSQDDYSVPLAENIGDRLEARGVRVDRESVVATQTDFSTVVANLAADTDVVVFATKTGSAAQALSQQLLEEGRRAVVFGTDQAYSPAQFKPRKGYVSSPANDLRFLAAAKKIVAEYRTFAKNTPFGTSGPPSYMAAWVIMDAARKACAHGKPTRAEVVTLVRKTNIPSILVGRIRFTAKGDVVGAKFFVFAIANGVYRNVA